MVPRKNSSQNLNLCHGLLVSRITSPVQVCVWKFHQISSTYILQNIRKCSRIMIVVPKILIWQRLVFVEYVSLFNESRFSFSLPLKGYYKNISSQNWNMCHQLLVSPITSPVQDCVWHFHQISSILIYCII